MAKKIIKGGSMFEVYTDQERKAEEIRFQKEYNKVKDKIIEIVEIKIVKKDFGYTGYDKSGSMHPIQKVIKNPKARQKYLLYLNDYQRIVKFEKIN